MAANIINNWILKIYGKYLQKKSEKSKISYKLQKLKTKILQKRCIFEN